MVAVSRGQVHHNVEQLSLRPELLDMASWAQELGQRVVDSFHLLQPAVLQLHPSQVEHAAVSRAHLCSTRRGVYGPSTAGPTVYIVS